MSWSTGSQLDALGLGHGQDGTELADGAGDDVLLIVERDSQSGVVPGEVVQRELGAVELGLERVHLRAQPLERAGGVAEPILHRLFDVGVDERVSEQLGALGVAVLDQHVDDARVALRSDRRQSLQELRGLGDRRALPTAAVLYWHAPKLCVLVERKLTHDLLGHRAAADDAVLRREKLARLPPHTGAGGVFDLVAERLRRVGVVLERAVRLIDPRLLQGPGIGSQAAHARDQDDYPASLPQRPHVLERLSGGLLGSGTWRGAR